MTNIPNDIAQILDHIQNNQINKALELTQRSLLKNPKNDKLNILELFLLTELDHFQEAEQKIEIIQENTIAFFAKSILRNLNRISSMLRFCQNNRDVFLTNILMYNFDDAYKVALKLIVENKNFLVFNELCLILFKNKKERKMIVSLLDNLKKNDSLGVDLLYLITKNDILNVKSYFMDLKVEAIDYFILMKEIFIKGWFNEDDITKLINILENNSKFLEGDDFLNNKNIINDSKQVGFKNSPKDDIDLEQTSKEKCDQVDVNNEEKYLNEKINTNDYELLNDKSSNNYEKRMKQDDNKKMNDKFNNNYEKILNENDNEKQLNDKLNNSYEKTISKIEYFINLLLNYVDDWNLYKYALDNNLNILHKKSVNFSIYKIIKFKDTKLAESFIKNNSNFTEIKNILNFVDQIPFEEPIYEILIKYLSKNHTNEDIKEVFYLYKTNKNFLTIKLLLALLISSQIENNLILAYKIAKDEQNLLEDNYEIKLVYLYLSRFFCNTGEVKRLFYELDIKNTLHENFRSLWSDFNSKFFSDIEYDYLNCKKGLIKQINNSIMLFIEKGLFMHSINILETKMKLENNEYSECAFKGLLGEKCEYIFERKIDTNRFDDFKLRVLFKKDITSNFDDSIFLNEYESIEDEDFKIFIKNINENKI